MKRALLIIGVLLFMFFTSFVVYSAYNNNVGDLRYDEVSVKDKVINSNGYFEAKIKCEVDGKEICDYDYKLTKTKLYITAEATASGKTKPLEVDSEGYVTITINLEGKKDKIEKVYYRYKDDDESITFTKEED